MSRSFDYTATFDESLAMLQDLCAEGFRVIPARTYPTAVAPEYAQVTDALVPLLREGPGFYLAGAFTTRPVPCMLLDGGPAAGRYSISGLTMGPVLDGLLARDTLVDGSPTLLSGFLLRQDRYHDPVTGRFEEASAALKAAYNLAVRTLKRRLVKHPLARFHIGQEALRRVRAGQARLQPGTARQEPG